MADTRRLPVPLTDIWDWQLRGACRGMDSTFFFHPEGERGRARVGREARAKQVCQGCPVLEQCRRHALAVEEPYGVWGGLSESERDEIVRSHTRTVRLPSTPATTRTWARTQQRSATSRSSSR
jgi:WhiB family redox-sensing transcriptional regulator